jgi:hypothetical protein
LIGHEEDLGCGETSGGILGSWDWGQETCRAGEASYDRWQARADEAEEHRQGPWGCVREDRAYLRVVGLDAVDRCEA